MMTDVAFPDERGKEVRKEGETAIEGKIFMGLHFDGRLRREHWMGQQGVLREFFV